MFSKEVPIDSYQEQILHIVNQNPITIITAETGSGKSTRIPAWFFNQKKKVIITQPRRIAARALSYYLSKELQFVWGEEIGYQTALEEKCSPQTRLLYVTDGIQMVQEIRGIFDYDILLLDEVHEWNLYQEVLIALLEKRLNKGQIPSGKRYLILSATLDARKLSSFLHDAPIINVQSRKHPITILERSPLLMLPDAAQYLEEKKNLLIFQQGKREIENFHKELERILHAEKIPAIVLPLHSELTLEEQNRVFQNYPQPKAVIATNIAQTSLTIDDIDIVLDDGLKKELQVEKNIEGLYPAECSKADCLQRAGRVGRTKEGTYILYSELPLSFRQEFSEPEIRRLHMENILLRMLKWGIDPLQYRFFHPLRLKSLHNARNRLMMFDALDDNGQISEIGKKMADLPLSLRAARMAVEAEGYTPEIFLKTLRLIAILESKGIVRSGALAELPIANGQSSDLLCQLEIWENQKIYRSLINLRKLNSARSIYQQLKKRITLKAKSKLLAIDSSSALQKIILSAFPEGIYRLDENGLYARDNQLRSLEASSVLLKKRPQFVCGLPFDLAVLRENPLNRSKEKIYFHLLTFCTEISLPILQKLKPAHYHKVIRVELQKDQLIVHREHFWKQQLFFSEELRPAELSSEEKQALIEPISNWLKDKSTTLKLDQLISRLKTEFKEISHQINISKNIFPLLWKRFLKKLIIKEVRASDLNYFVQSSDLLQTKIFQLLPPAKVNQLQKFCWPKAIKLFNCQIKVTYKNLRPMLLLSFAQLKKVERTDLLLPNGLTAGIIVDQKEFTDYEQAVNYYNQTISRELYWRKWVNIRQKTTIQEIYHLQFPIPFQAGRGKDEQPITFYIVPQIENGQLFLIHLFSKEEANQYWHNFLPQWNQLKSDYSRQTFLQSVAGKGWKVNK